VLDALDALGLRGDGRLLQLNSFENRVFQVFLEDGTVVVTKFYRPGRWSDAQILEEHAFARELAAQELPAVAPLALGSAGTLAHAGIQGQDFRLAVYPRVSGHGPELDDPATLRWLGRFVARLHVVGECRAFAARRRLDPGEFGHAALDRILRTDQLAPAERGPWESACRSALERVDAAWAATPARTLRIHGDFHRGNILWRDPDEGGPGPQIVDLDDAVTGAAVQDLWLLLSGETDAMHGQLAPLLEGYRQFRDFDTRELALIEPLRTLRMIHHSAWLAERWDDPAFPVAFPWFGTPSYWAQQTTLLREQVEAMAEPPLETGFVG
jgi:Ser/Thr protein kinase RdoA (MazF antagonist)